MSITQKYIHLKRYAENLEKLLSLLCEKMESGEQMNETDPEIESLYVWWQECKKRNKRSNLSTGE